MRQALLPDPVVFDNSRQAWANYPTISEFIEALKKRLQQAKVPSNESCEWFRGAICAGSIRHARIATEGGMLRRSSFISQFTNGV